MTLDLGTVSASITVVLHGISSLELAVVPGAALFVAGQSMLRLRQIAHGRPGSAAATCLTFAGCLFLAFGSDQALAALTQ